jgi:hypothetical protein
MDDLDKLANEIRALCNGHPHAKIAWPHRELHALADRAQALARRDGVEGPVAWKYELASSIRDDGTYTNWQPPVVRLKKPHVPEGSIRNLTPLFAHPAPTAPGDGPLWMMHVRGPDDIYPAPDYETALAWCDYVNTKLAPVAPDVLASAVPALWTGTADAHAEWLPEAIKGWTVPDLALRQPDTAAKDWDAIRAHPCYGEHQPGCDCPDPSTAEDASMAVGEECPDCDTSGRCTFVCEPTPSTAEDACMAGGEDVQQRAYDMLVEGVEGFDALSAAKKTDIHRVLCAALRTPADPRPDPLEALREARFLEARLSEFENEDLSDEAARTWMGHVHPSLSRLRQALAKIKAVMGEAG